MKYERTYFLLLVTLSSKNWLNSAIPINVLYIITHSLQEKQQLNRQGGFMLITKAKSTSFTWNILPLDY